MITDVLRIFSAKLVLEVFGGAGAIWGFSEAVGLRTHFTVWFWRPTALIIGAIFFARWILQIIDFINESKGQIKVNSRFTNVQLVKDVLRVFSAKLVLEVFGGAGAIWGFSEAVTLRNPHTVWFWRPTALVVGAIFFARWMLQMKDFIDAFEKDAAFQQTQTSASLPEGLSERSGTVMSNTGLSETDSLVPKYGAAVLT
mmetsp:Transcript_628/g.1014  ORF Transcript_628/g.1014 Transcript_628/m.1014 type:complete len:199 (+) Transcript_628:77-673(+)